MGLDFSVGRPTPTLEADFALLESHVDEGGGVALARVRERVEEELGGLGYTNWAYADDAPDGAHWAYSGFMRFRRRVAALEGITLEEMWGYGPNNDVEAYMRMHPDAKIGGLPAGTMDGAKDRYFAEVVKRWEDFDTPLRPFLDHSDCDEEMSPEECAQVAPRLRECVEELAAEERADLAHWQTNDVENGRRLVAQMEFCVANDYHLLFR